MLFRTWKRVDRRRRLWAWSLGVVTMGFAVVVVMGGDELTGLEGDAATVAIGTGTGTISWVAAADAAVVVILAAAAAMAGVVSGSERQSPSSRCTNIPESRVSMWVKLLERPCKKKERKKKKKQLVRHCWDYCINQLTAGFSNKNDCN